MITGKDLLQLGFEAGPHFAKMLKKANELQLVGEELKVALQEYLPPKPIPLQSEMFFYENIVAENADEVENLAMVRSTMKELMRTPVIRAGAIMPDSCPAGPLGTIPVGGVVSSEAIHPGMHSADICCSMAISVVPGASPADLLDAMHKVTHFGPGGRDDIRMTDALAKMVDSNAITKPFMDTAHRDMGTQGDGNHFAFVGVLRDGRTALVTHHGSRGFGAKVYKAGLKIADQYRRRISPETLPGNAWIPADTKDGDEYWQALQVVRTWTKENHYTLHNLALWEAGELATDRFWNEHNFVFRKPDGLFYHAKGATPAFDGWAHDATDLTIIPMNMAEPVLIVRGKNAPHGLGFSPHGAGRNYSRTAHRRRLAGMTDEQIVADETHAIDARFFMGIPDISELPSAYKNAAAVKRQIVEYGLAEIVDEVFPHGCIMAGDWERNEPWRKKKPSA